MKTLLAFWTVLVLVSPAWGLSFDFGFSPTITVRANESVVIPGSITNTGDTAIEFGCAITTCGGLDFGASIDRGPGEGINALNFSTGGSFYSQFVGVVIAPSDTFQFAFGTITFNPLETAGNPLGTILHPTFGFDFRNPPVLASLPTTITAGEQVSFAPFTFVSSVVGLPTPDPVPTGSVPLPSMFWPTLAGLLGLIAFTWKRGSPLPV